MNNIFLKTDAEREIAQQIVDVVNKSGMSRKQAVKTLQKAYKRTINEEQKRLEEAKGKVKDLRHRIRSFTDLGEWALQPPVLQKNECSRLHKLQEATKQGKLALMSRTSSNADRVANNYLFNDAHVFVVKHDWSAALKVESGGDIVLPYDHCAFEMKINGNVFIIIAMQNEGVTEAIPFVEVGEMWICLEDQCNEAAIVKFSWDQIRAICIALDAEVATHTVERAPVKLNAKRVRDGKVPLSDYSVIDLSRRHNRVANHIPGTGTGTHKRLHFRRGHWRHFETSKTWVKWCLVGDPDLGFVNKQYTL